MPYIRTYRKKNYNRSKNKRRGYARIYPSGGMFTPEARLFKARGKIGVFNMHRFKRKCRLGTVTIDVSGNGYQGSAHEFKLGDLPNYTELTALYDQFRIDYVKLYYVSRGYNLSVIESYNNASLGMPELIAVIDRDDSTAPASSDTGMNTLREYSKSRSYAFTGEGRVWKIGLQPSILTSAYESGISTAYLPKVKQFIDCNNYATPHYGVKTVVRVPFSTGVMPGTYTFDVYATYWLTMKNTR